MALVTATEVTQELRDIWDRALIEVASQRGGPELVATLYQEVPFADALSYVVAQRALETEVRDGQVVGLAVRSGTVIAALYVVPAHRGGGVAREMVTGLLARGDAPEDAWALPGDRATKSLYESLGWKARLLTMRAAE